MDCVTAVKFTTKRRIQAVWYLVEQLQVPVPSSTVRSVRSAAQDPLVMCTAVSTATQQGNGVRSCQWDGVMPLVLLVQNLHRSSRIVSCCEVQSNGDSSLPLPVPLLSQIRDGSVWPAVDWKSTRAVSIMMGDVTKMRGYAASARVELGFLSGRFLLINRRRGRSGVVWRKVRCGAAVVAGRAGTPGTPAQVGDGSEVRWVWAQHSRGVGGVGGDDEKGLEQRTLETCQGSPAPERRARSTVSDGRSGSKASTWMQEQQQRENTTSIIYPAARLLLHPQMYGRLLHHTQQRLCGIRLAS